MEELVLQAQGGDTTAFEALYRQQVGRIYALCRRMTGKPELAEDLTQEAFIRAWERLATFRPEGGHFGAWLYKVAVNVVLTDRRVRRRRVPLFEVDDPERWDPAAPPERPETGLDLEFAIDQLPPGARKVFVLHDVEGLRHKEIADRLGLSQGTTKAQLHRARRMLRRILEPGANAPGRTREKR